LPIEGVPTGAQHSIMPPDSQTHRLDEIKREVSVHVLDQHWRDGIVAAPTEIDLLALARRYMLSHESTLVEGLQGLAVLPRITTAGDVSLITYRLRRLYCSPLLAAPSASFVEHALAFFDSLCERIFDLRSQEDARQRPLPARISANG